ncbi:MAG: CBS domain-containing protein [Desulfosarcina sp.]|jgi:CBS domain-containing protein
MLAKDIMTTKVEYVSEKQTLKEAAELMQEKDVGELPVVVNSEAVGIITDRDIVTRAVSHGLDPNTTKVIDAMSEGVVACGETDDILQVVGMMGSQKIRRLPVVDIDNKMTGVISISDLAMHMNESMVGDLLRQISTGA